MYGTETSTTRMINESRKKYDLSQQDLFVEFGKGRKICFVLVPVVQSPIKLILDKWKFNCYVFTVKGGFFTKLRFKEKKFVIYNLIGPQFCKSSFSGE